MKINKEDLLARLKEYTNLGKSIESDLRHFVVDKDIPLDDRWNIFVESKMGDRVYREEFPHIDDTTQAQELYLEKDSVTSVADLLEMAFENDIIFEYDHKKIEEYKEHCLDGFIKEMQWSW